jgi:hypothetical protein
MHRLSPVLTLHGAVAHTDMPVESRPTMYLLHSQKYEPGHLAWRRPEFRAHFDANYVQLPLPRGDAAVFNPALFHAAGHNRSADVRRMANLLQVSSAVGRAMESVDWEKMSNAVFPVLLALRRGGSRSPPTSTATSRSTDWLRRARPTFAGGPSGTGGTRRRCATNFMGTRGGAQPTTCRQSVRPA